jgi:hypothetical protein
MGFAARGVSTEVGSADLRSMRAIGVVVDPVLVVESRYEIQP